MNCSICCPDCVPYRAACISVYSPMAHGHEMVASIDCRERELAWLADWLAQFTADDLSANDGCAHPPVWNDDVVTLWLHSADGRYTGSLHRVRVTAGDGRRRPRRDRRSIAARAAAVRRPDRHDAPTQPAHGGCGRERARRRRAARRDGRPVARPTGRTASLRRWPAARSDRRGRTARGVAATFSLARCGRRLASDPEPGDRVRIRHHRGRPGAAARHNRARTRGAHLDSPRVQQPADSVDPRRLRQDGRQARRACAVQTRLLVTCRGGGGCGTRRSDRTRRPDGGRPPEDGH